MSAAPMGRPGWPELAFSTASADKKRIALAIWLDFSELVMFTVFRGGKEMPLLEAGQTKSKRHASHSRCLDGVNKT